MAPGTFEKYIENPAETLQIDDTAAKWHNALDHTIYIKRHAESEYWVCAITSSDCTITADTIRAHPRIIKILRYMPKMSLSQMKAGQMAGVTTTRNYESEDPATPHHETAGHLADYIKNNPDERKVP